MLKWKMENRKIVKHFRRSNFANDKLIKYQQDRGKTPLKVILDVATRWNSTLYMLQRFIELEESIKSTTAIIDKELPTLTAGEWAIIKELCQILKPFEDATKAISGEAYCTGSMVIPIGNRSFLNIPRRIFPRPFKEF